MSFKDDFRKALHDGQASLYDAFVDRARRNLPNDADSRYQYLRSPQGRFVARDEGDVDVYTVKVADRHREKFRWLYNALFTAYQPVFTKDVDLVIWGCGCGLDLLALYDRALAQRNPQLWMKVRHITLIDLSEAALGRAKSIAEILFPLADVVATVCDLSRPEEIRRKVRLRPLTAYLPRIHLISNLLDLFQDVRPMAEAVMRQSAWNIASQLYYNELVVAFSPEYRGGQVADNIVTFKNVWTWTRCVGEIQTVGDVPMNCEFCAFACCTLKNSRCYRSYIQGRNPALNRMVSQCPLVQKGFDFHKFVSALSKLTVCGHTFFRIYRWAEVIRYRDLVERIAFVADPSITPRVAPCVVEIGTVAENVQGRLENASTRALKALIKRRGEDCDSVRGQASDIKAIYWDGSELRLGVLVEPDEWVSASDIDYSLYFRIDPGDAAPLSDLNNSMDATQKEIIYLRSQYRKIRGGAGCGKSTTMMWHAVMSVLRTHLPALLVCKTVTLFNRHVRRLAATMLKEVPELEYVDSDLFVFKTLDKVLCEHRQVNFRGCVLRKTHKSQYSLYCFREIMTVNGIGNQKRRPQWSQHHLPIQFLRCW